MKVDTETVSEQWTDLLSIRIQLPRPSEVSPSETSDESLDVERPITPPPGQSPFTRVSPVNLMALRSLPAEAPLLLLTPFVVPAGMYDEGDNTRRRDPFESFGRELARHHPNICHVPYVTGVGFTETHRRFVRQSEAIITVVCEPERGPVKQSIGEQHDFAEAALKAFASRPTKLDGGRACLLVQCAGSGACQPAQHAFTNVVDVDFYSDQTAEYLADIILGET